MITTTQNGTWDTSAGGCFNGTSLPTSADDVTIAHTVSGNPVITCKTILVTLGLTFAFTGTGSTISAGRIKGDTSGETLTITGNLTMPNDGTAAAFEGFSTLTISGNLIITGVIGTALFKNCQATVSGSTTIEGAPYLVDSAGGQSFICPTVTVTGTLSSGISTGSGVVSISGTLYIALLQGPAADAVSNSMGTLWIVSSTGTLLANVGTLTCTNLIIESINVSTGITDGLANVLAANYVSFNLDKTQIKSGYLNGTALSASLGPWDVATDRVGPFKVSGTSCGPYPIR